MLAALLFNDYVSIAMNATINAVHQIYKVTISAKMLNFLGI